MTVFKYDTDQDQFNRQTEHKIPGGKLSIVWSSNLLKIRTFYDKQLFPNEIFEPSSFMWCGFCCVFWPHDSVLKIKKSAIIPKILLDAVSYLKNFQSLLIISENDEIKDTFGNVIGKFVYGWNLTRYFFNFYFHERNTWSRVQRINRPYFWHSSGPKLGPFSGLEFVSYRFKVWILNSIKK